MSLLLMLALLFLSFLVQCGLLDPLSPPGPTLFVVCHHLGTFGVSSLEAGSRIRVQLRIGRAHITQPSMFVPPTPNTHTLARVAVNWPAFHLPKHVCDGPIWSDCPLMSVFCCAYVMSVWCAFVPCLLRAHVMWLQLREGFPCWWSSRCPGASSAHHQVPQGHPAAVPARDPPQGELGQVRLFFPPQLMSLSVLHSFMFFSVSHPRVVVAQVCLYVVGGMHVGLLRGELLCLTSSNIVLLVCVCARLPGSTVLGYTTVPVSAMSDEPVAMWYVA